MIHGAKARVVVIVAAAVACGSSSCGSRYDLKEDKQGRTIRVDKWTGEITIIEGNKLITPKTDQEDAAEKKGLEVLASPKWWPPENLKKMGGISASLTTSWHGKPVLSVLRNSGNGVYEE